MEKKNKLAKRATPTQIISHWPKLLENFRFSTHEFYDRVEKALAERQVPNLKTSRVDWKEGGGLSARREYLRLQRQRLVFDVCAAPFGTGFFVSIWFGQKPLRLGLIVWFFIILGVLAVFELLGHPQFGLYSFFRSNMGLDRNAALSSLGLIAFSPIVAMIIRIGPNLDDFLVSAPVLGFFYERYFRKITYYRMDLACMYQAAVHAAVTQVIDEISKTQSIQPLSEFDRRPIMKELYLRQGRNGHN